MADAVRTILVDPLTSPILLIEETEKMAGELFEKEAKYLHGFA